jgi:hypothetical protein
MRTFSNQRQHDFWQKCDTHCFCVINIIERVMGRMWASWAFVVTIRQTKSDLFFCSIKLGVITELYLSDGYHQSFATIFLCHQP